jgi:hypothetical protein
MPELRCGSKLHGIGIDASTIEVKCSSSFCGAAPGVTVLHRFNINTGELLDTDVFRDIPKKGK